MKHNLYFERSNGESVLIEENVTTENVVAFIKQYITKINPNYQIPYFRVWSNEDCTIYDAGSHTEFFIIRPKFL